jgi:hypothetical protein
LNLTDLSVKTRDSLSPGNKTSIHLSGWDNFLSLKLKWLLIEEDIALAEEVNEDILLYLQQ